MGNNVAPLDMTLKWEIPTRATRTKSPDLEPELILLKRIDPKIHSFKYARKFLNFKSSNIEKFWNIKSEDLKDHPELTMSLAFDKQLFVSFNPGKGVPKLPVKLNGKDRYMNDRTIVDKIYDFFKLDKEKPNYYLKAHRFGEMNGMVFYVLTPQDYDTKLPLFEDEIKGTWSPRN